MPRAAREQYILYADPPALRLPLYVTEIGASWWPEGGRAARASSAILAIELVGAGVIRLVQDGRESRIATGEAFVLKRGARHEYTAVDGAARKRFLGVDGTLAEQLAEALPDRIAFADPAPARRILDRMLALFHARRPDWQLDAAGLAYRLFAELAAAAHAGAAGGGRRHPAVDEALRLIHRPGTRIPSLPWLARQAGTSATHLGRLFQVALGTSPLRYARRCAIDQARHLLANSTLSCQAIAARLGYDDPLYFSAVFKRLTGESPTTFRRRQG
jgi:AraC-like DNA-binding protein